MGTVIWSGTTYGPVDSSPAVANGVVYVGSEDDSIYAFNATTGHLLWSYTTGSYIEDSPTIANGMVYVASWTDYKLHAFALP